MTRIRTALNPWTAHLASPFNVPWWGCLRWVLLRLGNIPRPQSRTPLPLRRTDLPRRRQQTALE